jgi:dTDP-4-dehydrorhamnose reductase
MSVLPIVDSGFEAAPRILVIGARGQIGAELVSQLQGLGALYTPQRSTLDLTDADSIRATIRELQPVIVINAAAYTDVAGAELQPALAHAVNAVGAGIVAEAALQCGAALIHYSTDYVFDGEKADAYREDDIAAPLNQYGLSKLAGERAISQVGGQYLIFRTSWIYGLRGRNFLSFVMREAACGRALRIVADQFGAPTWSRTVADLTTQVVRQGLRDGEAQRNFWTEHTGAYHLSAAGRTSWHGFAQAIVESLAPQEHVVLTTISTTEFGAAMRRPSNSVLATAKFSSTFGISPPDWRDALAQCLACSESKMGAR